MWYDRSVIYQIYPLGLCGAPQENDGVTIARIRELIPWAEHIRALGADTVLLNPSWIATATAMIPGTIIRWTAAWEQKTT